MTLNVFISQPMSGLSEEEILHDRERATAYIEYLMKDDTDIRILDSVFRAEFEHPIRLLAKAISVMADADIVVMARGWRKARGCKVEHEVAKQYNICVIEEG